MSQPLLFSTTLFATAVAGVNSTVRRAIELLTAAHFAGKTVAQVSTELYQANKLTNLALQTGSATQSPPTEVPIDVTDEMAATGKRLVEGTRFRFHVPFTGPASWLSVAPTSYEGDLPFGTVGDARIDFLMEQPADSAVASLVAAYQTNINQLNTYASLLNQNINNFNTALQQQISNDVAARKARLDKLAADAQAFGVPVQ